MHCASKTITPRDGWQSNRWLIAAAITMLFTAALGGCATTASEDFAVVLIELHETDHLPAPDLQQAVERRWVSTQLWPLDGPPPAGSRELLVQLTTPTHTGEKQSESYTLDIDPAHIGSPRTTQAQLDGPLVVAVDRPGASLAFAGGVVGKGDSSQPVYGGITRVSFSRDFLSAARQVDKNPTVVELMRAALLGLNADALRQYNALELSPSLAQVVELTRHEIPPADIAALYDAGYTFTVPELVRLDNAGARVQDAVAMREGGLNYDVNELIRLHNARVDAPYALGMKEAGFAQSVEQLARLRRVGVEPLYAQRMKQMRVVTNDRQLIQLHQAGVAPETVATYQQAKYEPTVTELLLLKQRGVNADDALAFRKTGYNFTLEELMRLARWRVPRDFVVALMSDEFEPLSTDAIVDLHLRRVTPDMIRSLRKARSGAGILAPVARDDHPEE